MGGERCDELIVVDVLACVDVVVCLEFGVGVWRLGFGIKLKGGQSQYDYRHTIR